MSQLQYSKGIMRYLSSPMARRLYAAAVFIAALSAYTVSVKATNITVSSFQPGLAWNYGGSTATIRVYVSQSLVTSDGISIVASPVGGAGFYRTINCTIAGTVITVNSFTIPSTTDATPTTARYTFIFFQGSTKRDVLWSNYQVPVSLGTTISNSQLEIYNRTAPAPPRPGFPTIDQVQQLINAVAPAPKSATTVNGIGKVSVNPADATNPIFVGANDPALGRVFNITGTPYNALCDGSTNDTTAINAAVTAAALVGGSIYIPPSTSGCKIGTANITVPAIFDGGTLLLTTGQTTTFSRSIIAPLDVQIFRNALSGQGTVALTGQVSPIPDWWTTNTTQGTTDMTAAIQAALASLSSRGGKVTLLSETYLTGQLNIVKHGTTIEGQGGHINGGAKPTTLLYTGLANGSSGIVNAGYYGMTLRNFYMEMVAGTGGSGIKVTGASQALVEDVDITNSRGATFIGIQMGDTSSGAGAVIVSTVRRCHVGGPADVAFLAGQGSTSIHFDNDYGLGYTNAGFEFYQSKYSGATECGADSGLTGASGYLMSGANGVTLTSCGAESNGKGYARLMATTVGVTIIDGVGNGNNTSADATIGSFLQLDAGANRNINLIGCQDLNLNAATAQNIYGGAGNQWTNIIGYNESDFTKGYDGDATWKSSYLSLVKGGELYASSLFVGLSNGGFIAVQPRTDTYSNAVAINTGVSNHTINASFTTSATSTYTPSSGGFAGQLMIITTKTDASGTVTVTFGGTFHSSGTQATTASHFSTILFLSDGTRWVEVGRTTNLA